MSFGPAGVLLGPCLVASVVIGVKAAARIATAPAGSEHGGSGNGRASDDVAAAAGGVRACAHADGASPPARPLVPTLTSPPTPAPNTITRRQPASARAASDIAERLSPRPACVRGPRELEWGGGAHAHGAPTDARASGSPGGGFLRELADGYAGVRRSIHATGRRISREIDARQAWAARADDELEHATGVPRASVAAGAADTDAYGSDAEARPTRVRHS